MGGKISAEMKAAIRRVELGETAYAAAKAEGVTATGLRRSAGYQALLIAGKVNFGQAGRKNKKPLAIGE